MTRRLRFIVLLALLVVLPTKAQDSSGNLLESAGKFLINLGKPGSDTAAPSLPAETPDRNLRPQAASGTGKRVALIIGNGNYRSNDLSKLPNPTNDADDIARELQRFGFEVLAHKNLDRRQMKDAIAEFGRKSMNADASLFYFAGHGIQIKNQNYLVPVDAAARSEADIEDEGININYPLGEMENAQSRINLVLLDACRNNSFSGKFRSGASRGLAAPGSLPKGTVIVYATDPGNTASDGTGRNGLFTEGFLAGLKGDDLSLDGVLTKASEVVEQKSKGKQTPYINGPKLVQRNFHFIFKGPTTVIVQPQTDPETEAWSTAQGIGSQAAYEAYLDSYPKGRYAAAAKIKLADLKKSENAKPTPVAAPSIPADDPDTAFWNEVKSNNSREYYDAYVKQYPKGKYLALARLELKKLEDVAKADAAKQEAERKAAEARAEAERKQLAEQQKQDQLRAEREAWERAKGASSLQGYTAYLDSYPKGQFAALAQAARQKAEREQGEREQQEAETRRKAQEQERLAAEKADKDMYPGKVFRDCADCPEMVVIPAGSFMMGSPANETGRFDNDGPVHLVSLKSFALSKTEVTLGEFRTFTQKTGYLTTAEQDSGRGCYAWDTAGGKWDWRIGRHWQNPGFTQNERQPVICVSWDDAQAYVKWLNQQQRATYRLPSEAEWEYAARAGSSTALPWGYDLNQACRYANVADQTNAPNGGKWDKKHECYDGYWFTAPVASFTPNNFGLHDMIGNAWEWTQDCWNDNYNGAPNDGRAWTGGDCSRRVARGGSWYNTPQLARSAVSKWHSSAIRTNDLGFRLARTLSP